MAPVAVTRHPAGQASSLGQTQTAGQVQRVAPAPAPAPNFLAPTPPAARSRSPRRPLAVVLAVGGIVVAVLGALLALRAATGSAPPPPAVEVRMSGFTTGTALDEPAISFGAVLFNPSDKVAKDVTIKLDIKDAAGKLIKTETTYVDYVLPHREGYAVPSIKVDKGAAPAAAIDVHAQAAKFVSEAPPQYTVQEATFVPDEYQGLVRGTVTSPLSRPTKAQVQCVVFGGPAVIGGSFDFVDLVPANGTTGFEASTGLVMGTNPTQARCQADESTS